MAKMNDERRVRILGEILVRTIYFALGFVVFVFVAFRLNLFLMLQSTEGCVGFVATMLVVCVATALIGPFLCQRALMRGRGTLEAVKAASQLRRPKR